MVSAAPLQEFLQCLPSHGGDRPPRGAGMLADGGCQPCRDLDREHHGHLGNRHPARCRRLVHVPAGPPLGAPQPPAPHPPAPPAPPPPPPPLARRADPLRALTAAARPDTPGRGPGGPPAPPPPRRHIPAHASAAPAAGSSA